MQLFSVHITKLSLKKSCMDTASPDLLILLLFKSHPIHENTCQLVCWWLVPRVYPCQPCQHPFWLSLSQFLLSSKGPFDDGLVKWLCLEDWKAKMEVKCWNVKVIQICTFPASLSTERVLSLAPLSKCLDLGKNFRSCGSWTYNNGDLEWPLSNIRTCLMIPYYKLYV